MSRSKDGVLKKLTWSDIQEWAGDTIASRGRSYQHGHRVQKLARTPGGGLVAWVKGMKNYATLVDIEDDELTALCTCPFDDVCKHAVAVLLEYMEKLKQNISVPVVTEGDERMTLLENLPGGVWDKENEDIEHVGAGATPDALRSYLEQQSKAELISMLEDMSRRYPAVRDTLQDRYHLLKGDVAVLVKALRNEVDKLGAGPEPDRRGYWRNEDADYAGIRDRLEMLLAKGHADEVAGMGKRLLEAGIREVETIDDEGESVEEIASCMGIVFKALSRSSLPPAEQMLWAVEAELQDEYDLCSGAGVFWEQQQAVADWNTLAEKLLPRLNNYGMAKGEDAFSRDYQRDRLSDWVIFALENAGCKDEVIPLCEREARETKSYVRLVKRLLEAGRRKEAEGWIQKGVRATKKSLSGIASQLRDILRGMREEEKDWLAVAALRGNDFFARPELASFKELQKAAEKAGVCPEVRASAMHFLKTGEPPERKEKTTPEGLIPPWPLPETGVQEVADMMRGSFPMTGVLIDIAIAEKRSDEVIRWYDLREDKLSRWRWTWS